MSDSRTVTAFAPASIGNVGVGFDMLGLAIAGAGDRVSARRVPGPGVRIAEVRGLDGEVHPTLSADADGNTASVAAAALWLAAGGDGGLELVVRKGVPLQSGMGSSAASAVAGAVAANALLERPLPLRELLPFALAGEKVASGGIHADNVAPSLIGGMVLCPPVLLPRMIALPTPQGISSVLLHPDLLVSTAESRRKLARGYSMDQWLTQQGYLAGFIAALEAGDVDLLRECLQDVIIEPQRASSVPCFPAVKEAALAAGALGSSLSGSGPSVFALCEDQLAPRVRVAMEQACRGFGYDCQSWVSPLNAPGAHLEELP
ncbi:MAG: homoserine kinase [Gammaproteobacteria bacterium]|nr:homoserine kinase [Gammaproteobacteria bacterium]MDH4256456.1 homoserine kinase [Gammaproteobacteria bacterium]MDH5312141.1 homoserine kinase [Gammaproteobacteria bacterium]